MKYSQLLVIIPTALALTACATAHRGYIPPTSGEVAFLRVVADDGSPLPGSVFISTFEKAETCQRRYFFQGVPSQMRQTDITLHYAKIPAGNPFSIAVNIPIGGSLSTGFKICVPVAMFTPQSGKYYKATVEVDKQEAFCYLSLTESAQGSGTLRSSVPIKAMRFSNGLDEDSSFCSPQ